LAQGSQAPSSARPFGPLGPQLRSLMGCGCGSLVLSDDMDSEAAKILRRGDLRLVSGLWLLSQSESYRVQRLQELPREALVPPRDAAAMMLESRCDEHRHDEHPPRVLALSYRWLTPEHPDPEGIQLEKVRHFLKSMVEAVFRSRGEESARAKLDIGILWDYMSLPQHPRSESEKDVFSRGLKAINRVYGSKERTLTLQCIGDPDGSHPYHKSGWCRFEEAVSGIGKQGSLLLAVEDRPKDEETQPTHACRFIIHPGLAVLEAHGLDDIATRLGSEYSRLSPQQDWKELCSKASSARLPPVHPEDMARLLRSDEVTFTNKSDVEMVIEKYRDFFRKMADRVTRLAFDHRVLPGSEKTQCYGKITWSPEQFRLLGRALGDEGGLQRCGYLGLGGVNLCEAGARILAEALVEARSLKEVQLPTTIEDRSANGYGMRFRNQSVEPAAVSLLSQKLAERSVEVSYCEDLDLKASG